MANFFVATAVYADGTTKKFEGRLWLLGGIKDKKGHALLAKLRADHEAGVIIRLSVSYES